MKWICALLVCLVWMHVGAAEPGPATAADLVPLEIKLQRRMMGGDWHDFARLRRERPEAEDWTEKPPRFMVPRGTRNLALHKPVTSSDMDLPVGRLEQITDGDKDGIQGSWIELNPGKQWVQIDLGRVSTLHAILIWHNGGLPGLYHDVIVQLSNDAAFEKGVETIFNNDQDNSSKMGKGNNPEYFEARGTKIIDAKGIAARYVRMYSNGCMKDELNRYAEGEVYGLPEGDGK